MAYTLAEAQTMLTAYIEAEKAVLGGQSYSIGNRALSRADLEEIRKGRDEWNKVVSNLTDGIVNNRVTRIIPKDN